MDATREVLAAILKAWDDDAEWTAARALMERARSVLSQEPGGARCTTCGHGEADHWMRTPGCTARNPDATHCQCSAFVPAPSPSPGEAPRERPVSGEVREVAAEMPPPPNAPSAESDLEALQKLCDEATPGPWEHCNDGDGRTLDAVYGQFRSDLPIHPAPLLVVRAQGPRDARFIAAARTALPALIAELRALRRAGGRT